MKWERCIKMNDKKMWEIGVKCNLNALMYVAWAYEKTERNQKQGYVPFLKTRILKDIRKDQ